MLCVFQGKAKNYPIYGPPINAHNVMKQKIVIGEYDFAQRRYREQTAAIDTINKV